MSTTGLTGVAPRRHLKLDQGSHHDFHQGSAARRALQQARSHLLSLQRPDGHWCAELQGDTILESEYVLLMAFLGREGDDHVRKACNYILTQQRPEGAWSNYPGGPVDVTVSVKAYFALKIAGHAPHAPYMVRARELILAHGGAEACNSFTKFYLALLGQFPYDRCVSVPPEMMFLPRWFYVNLYAMSSWTRTIVVPLSIFSAHKPVRHLPPALGIRELFRDSPQRREWPHPPAKRLFTWHNFFLLVDQAVKLWETIGSRSFRKKAVDEAARWMIERFEDSDGVGAIFPPIVYTIISLRCLGYPDDSEEMRYALRQLDDLKIEEDDTLRLQPCFSPVWDTALAVNALAMGNDGTAAEALDHAADWLLEREVRRRGDWSLMNPDLEPGGWFFEYRNAFYPDVDDTAMVLMGLARSGHAYQRGKSGEQRKHAAVRRGLNWLLGMQNRDGGWAAFDRDIDRRILEEVPFADHNAMLDPSCPDITARVLECLGQFGFGPHHPQVQRALDFIASHQDPRGCWIGRWGVNYLYGTWQVLVGLEAIGFDMQHPLVRKAVRWLESVQQPSGAWGESCRTYDEPSTAGQGAPTPSQTGWALLGLIAAGERDSEAVRRGIDWLVAHQDADGGWQEEEFTGTGFPKVFYLKYHYYRLYFPLMALARFLEGRGAEEPPTVRHRIQPGYLLERLVNPDRMAEFISRTEQNACAFLSA